MKKLLALTGMTLAFTASSMFGAMVTFQSIPSGTITAPGTFDFSQFDTTFGTLTNITVNLSTSVNTTLTVFNSTSNALSFSSATVSVPFALTFTGGTGTYNFAGVATDNTGAVIAPFTSFMETINATNATSFDISPFAGYTGTGTTPNFSLASGGQASASGTGGQGLLYGGQGTGSVIASITYTYTPPSTGAPEPATMTLFGSALLGIGFFARKRIKKS